MESVKTREGASEVKQLISFTVRAEEYGLELLRVKEVIRMRPHAPEYMASEGSLLCERHHQP